MQSLSREKLSAVVLVGSLLLNVVYISCAAETTAPIQQSDQSATILAKLDAITARLDSVEAALSKQSDTVTHSLTTIVTALGGTGGTGGTGVASTHVTSQVDSILALASYIADNSFTPSIQFCASYNVGAKGGISGKLAAEGDGKGDVGAWAGTGAFAGIGVKASGEESIGIEGGLGGSVQGCVSKDLAPPSRNALLDNAPSALRTALSNLQSSMHWSDDPISTGVSKLVSLVGSGAPSNADIVSAISPPSSLSGALNDPTSYVLAQLPEKYSTAVSTLCNRSWNTAAVSSSITYACARISSGDTDIGAMYGMLNSFPAVQTASAAATAAVSGICSRLNSVGTKTLSIPNPLGIGPSPFYSARLFPDYSTPAGC